MSANEYYCFVGADLLPVAEHSGGHGQAGADRHLSQCLQRLLRWEHGRRHAASPLPRTGNHFVEISSSKTIIINYNKNNLGVRVGGSGE